MFILKRYPSEMNAQGLNETTTLAGSGIGLTLTQQQQAALEALEAFVDGDQKLFLLTGYAGSGKTTLLQVLLTRLQDKGDRRQILFTALSNKATKVLAEMADRWHLDVDCMTCCRLLGLQPEVDKETGLQTFAVDRKRRNLLTRYDLVVVDECSMINQEMWTLLVNAISRLDVKTQLLFVGDSAQLPPVNEARSPCFEQIIDRYDLTEVVRYGGAISVLAEDVRQNLQRPAIPNLTSRTNAQQTDGLFVVTYPIWEKLLLRAFASAAYQQNPDQVRALAYTNRRVTQLNRRIRGAIYGEGLERFVVGERLTANAPCLDGDTMLLQTSQECQVLEIRCGQRDGWRVWLLDIETDAGDYHRLRVLHEGEHGRLKRVLQTYADEKQWRLFWDMREFFHEVNYAYCLTVHKSQGSTFQDVFVDLPNLMTNRSVVERNQLCYVAFTRAAKRVFTVQASVRR